MKKLVLLCLVFVGAQERSHLESSPEADLGIASTYHNWTMGQPGPPPVLCLYGQRTGPISALLSAVQILDQRCPKKVGENPLFGVGYFVPPSHDSMLARGYFEDAACQIAEKLTNEVKAAPVVVVIVYSADIAGRTQYVYCITVPEDELRNSTEWREQT